MTFGVPDTMFGPTEFAVFWALAGFALTLWAATVAGSQRRLGVLERVLLVGIAAFSPFVGPIVVLVLAPRPGRGDVPH